MVVRDPKLKNGFNGSNGPKKKLDPQKTRLAQIYIKYVNTSNLQCGLKLPDMKNDHILDGPKFSIPVFSVGAWAAPPY